MSMQQQLLPQIRGPVAFRIETGMIDSNITATIIWKI